jgi:hypothetical protein
MNEQYYQSIEEIVGKTVEYYGMKCTVEQVFKYVKPEHELIAGFRAVYILKIINPTKEELNQFEDGYLFADTRSIQHSKELLTI